MEPDEYRELMEKAGGNLTRAMELYRERHPLPPRPRGRPPEPIREYVGVRAGQRFRRLVRKYSEEGRRNPQADALRDVVAWVDRETRYDLSEATIQRKAKEAPPYLDEHEMAEEEGTPLADGSKVADSDVARFREELARRRRS